MKGINIFIHLIAALCYVCGGIWGIIEGLKYAFRDAPVNWWFLLPLVGGLVIAILNMVAMFKRRW